MSEEYVLRRHGAPPLKFRGELLGEYSSRSHNGPRQTRWHELALYRTEAGKLVASIRFRTSWLGEQEKDVVFVCDDEKALIDALQNDFNPHAGWEGHPFGSRDAKRKNALIAESITDGYGRAVADLLSAAGIVETIE